MKSAFSSFLKIRPQIQASDWADLYRTLSPKASAEPGRWSTDRTPYLREFMDSFSDSDPTEIIVFKKSAQIGATEAFLNIIGYIIDYCGGPIVYILPTEDTTLKVSKFRLNPMFESAPLKNIIADKADKGKTNTSFLKEFPSGVFYMTWASSPSGMRSVPAQYIFFDEVDAYPIEIKSEGDPIELGKARTRTFASRKIGIISTPTGDNSLINLCFEKSDKRFYNVPCLGCGNMAPLKFENLKGDRDSQKRYILGSARHYCPKCGLAHTEQDKREMLSRGVWIPTAQSEIRGYSISSLYSTIGYTWDNILYDYFQSYKNPALLKVFVNTVLGEIWQESGDVPDWEHLQNRAIAFSVDKNNRTLCPPEVLFITAGIDIQQDRLEAEIRGWGRNKESWSLEYHTISGDTGKQEVYQKLHDILQYKFNDRLTLSLACIDSSYRPNMAYQFCLLNKRYVPIKGVDYLNVGIGSSKKANVTSANGKLLRYGVTYYNIGVNFYKSELYSNLMQEKTESSIGYINFPQRDDEYFKQLTAEVYRRKKNKKGYIIGEWHKLRDRNEALDCAIYNRAAASLVGIDSFSESSWQKLEKNLK